ncbi:MAG TPA: hypothetical protein VIO58_15490 [Candidatus Methanoperedens sp.]
MPSFIHDECGTLGIPLRLVVYVIMTAAIVSVAVVGFSNLKPGMTADIMEKQVGEIGVSLNNMQYGAARNLVDPASPPGNMRTFKIKIPENVGYLSFGADPDPDNDGNLTNTKEDLITGRGNVILYSSRAGKKRIPLEDIVEIREGLLENGRWVLNKAGGKEYGFVITGNGGFEITFELVYDPVSKGRYTLVHSTDDLDARINPYDITILPNNLRVSVDPKSIPADGITEANILVMLKDSKGRDASADGIGINLTSSYGNLSAANLTTFKGRATASITSDVEGTIVISASSPGLNPGSAYLTVTQVPIIFEFDNWINDSKPQIRNFTTIRELRYSIYFIGSATEFFGWPNASIELDGILIDEKTVDSLYVATKTYPQIALPAGNHTLSVRMTNDFYIPFVGERKLYVKSVILSE